MHTTSLRGSIVPPDSVYLPNYRRPGPYACLPASLPASRRAYCFFIICAYRAFAST
jgi:hypothetical protein